MSFGTDRNCTVNCPAVVVDMRKYPVSISIIFLRDKSRGRDASGRQQAPGPWQVGERMLAAAEGGQLGGPVSGVHLAAYEPDVRDQSSMFSCTPSSW